MWTRFDLSSVEDETINNAFCTNGLFKIGCEENQQPVSELPRVQSFVQNGKMIVAVEETLISLKDENCTEANLMQVNAKIDCFTMSLSGDIVVTCLSDGSIVGSHIQGTTLFKLSILEEDVYFDAGKTFQAIVLLNDVYYIMTVHGKLYRLSNVDEQMLSDTLLNNENETLSETLLNNTILERVINKKYDEKVESFIAIEHTGMPLCIYSIGKQLMFQKLNGSLVKILLPTYCSGLKSIFNFDSYIIGLSHEGFLLEICPFTKLISRFNEYTFAIEQLVVMESNGEVVELLILTKPDADNERVAKIILFPFMNSKNEMDLNMPLDTWLVNQPKCSINMYYLNGIRNESGAVHEIEMKLVSETEPSHRLKKLIQREHFDEAEDFAKQFELSLQPIYEAKARKCCNEIAFMPITNISEKFEELMALLKVIESKIFFISITQYEFPDRKWMRIFLEFIIHHLDQHENSNEIKVITEKLFRLETLSLIDPSESYTNWREFVNHTHLLKFCKVMFSANFSAAKVIWARHSASILPYATTNDLQGVIDAIPESVEPFEIVQWFKHFTPSALQIFPNFMSQIIDWSINKTKNLQYSPYWPEIGLEFMNNINGILKDVTFLYSNVQRKFETANKKIEKMIMALEDLSVLKKSYNLIVTMDDYIKDSMEDTAFNLLKCVQLSNFKALVIDFLYPIFKEQGESPEAAIKRYIKFLALHKSYRDWPERAVTAITFLHNETDKLDAVLMTLRSATVPWSSVLQELIKFGEGNHPLAQEIYVVFKSQTITVLKKKYEWPLNVLNTDSMLLVKRIVHVNLPEMLQDVRTVISNYPSIAMQANTYLAIILIESKQIEKALDYFKKLPTNEMETSFKHCIMTLIRLVDIDDLLQTNDCLEMIKCLNDYMNGCFTGKIQDVEKVLDLRKNFNIQVDLVGLSKVESLLSSGISRVVDKAYENFKTTKQCFNEILMNAKKLSKLLDLNILKVILETCKHVSSKTFTLNFIVAVLDISEVDRSSVLFVMKLCLFALEQHLTDTLNPDEEQDCMIFPVLHQILERVQKIDTLHVMELKELLQWTTVGVQFYSQSYIRETMKNYSEKFPIRKEIFEKQQNPEVPCLKAKNENQRESLSIFDTLDAPASTNDDSLNLQTHGEGNSSVQCLSLALRITVLNNQKEYTVFKEIFSKLVNQMHLSIEDALLEELTKMSKNKKHMDAFLILQEILRFERQNEAEIIPAASHKTLKYKILKTEITQKEPNFNNALKVLLSDLHPDHVLKALKETMHTETHIINYFTLLEKYHGIKQCPDQVTHAKDLRMQYQYHQELSRLNPSLKCKKTLNFSSAQAIMNELNGTMLSIQLIQKMSNDFNWNYEESLANQIIAYLLTLKPEFEIVTDVFGKEEILIKNDANEMLKVCQPYVNEIKDRSMLAGKLKQSFKMFNYYFYELYLCGIEILSYIDCLPTELNLWKNILMFLRQPSTVRYSRPGQLENDYWFKISSEGTVLPKISKYRLPFYPMIESQLKDILEDEICVETCEKWLPLIRFASYLKNENHIDEVEYFIMAAVKKSMLEPKNNLEENHWHFTETNNAFLQTVLRLITHMRTKPKIAFILYYISNNSPEGIDQLQATENCYNYVVQHETELEQHQKAKEVIKKIKYKYPILRIHHILHLYGLVEERLMNLAVVPYKLIYELYHHESIIKDQKIDINRVVAEIGSVSNTAYEGIQISLVQKWLGFESEPATNGSELNTLLLEDTIQNESNNEDEISDESVLRAYYVLKGWDVSKAMDFLMYEIMEKCSSNTAKELQLVECYSKLSENGDALDELVSSEHYSILKCVHDLRQLGYKMNKDKFKSVEKLALLKQIWKKHADDRKGLELIMYICLGFEIYEPQIWNGVLKQMIAMSMTQHLSSLVLILSTRSELLHISALVSAWSEVIKTPFKHCTKTRSYEQETRLSKALILLQACPVSNRLDYIELTEICLRLNRPHIAAIVAIYAEEKQKDKLTAMIKPFVSSTLKADIKDLAEHGVLKTIVQSALRNIGLQLE